MGYKKNRKGDRYYVHNDKTNKTVYSGTEEGCKNYMRRIKTVKGRSPLWIRKYK